MLDFLQLSFAPMLTGVFAGLACALPGNFLLLRRQALISDAVSHVVLPGVVIAFLLTGSVSAGPMLIGAAVAAAVAAALIEAIRRLGRLEPGAAMGVVFTGMFAAGALLLEQANLGGVHLDVEHALYGNLESLIWLGAEDWGSLADPVALADLPPELTRMAGAATLLAVLTWLFWRPLKLTAFDAGFAQSVGVPAAAVGFGLTLAAAVAAVAAFDAVGSILVIAMFICPPATARLCTDNLARQTGLSLMFATTSAVLGYVLAGYGPLWLGARDSVSAAGMIAVVSGLLLVAACLFGPRRKRVGAPMEG